MTTAANDEPQEQAVISSQAAMFPTTHPSRDAILEAYRAKHRELKERKKKQQKHVIIENVRKRAPHLVLRDKSKDHGKQESHKNLSNADSPTHSTADSPNRKRYRFSRFIPNQFKRKPVEEEQHPEGWAAARIQSAMRKHYIIQVLAANQLPNYLMAQSKKLYEECCKCYPLAHGPSMSKDGILQLAGPNLPRILRMLRSKKNVGIDLLQPHGISQFTVTHVAAQRGYTHLVRELIAHWTRHPMESPYQSYSIELLSRLLDLIRQLRQMKALVSESNSELRDLIKQIGVPFAHFSESLDRLHDKHIELDDLLRICGHPLVLCKDATGNTPLHYAAEGGYLSLCELLIEHGANINEQNKSGETPLHFAISSTHEEVCMYLVSQKADVNLCRYVSLTLLNDVTLRGTFVDAPDGHAVCKVMPVLQARSNVLVGNLLAERKSRFGRLFAPWSQQMESRWLKRTDAAGNRRAAVTPELPPSSISPRDGKIEGHKDDRDPPSEKNESATGMYTRVESLHQSSPLFRDRNPREIVFFRTAPGSSLMKPNILCVLLIGEHVGLSHVVKARQEQRKGKILHLLIQILPKAAMLAMDSFRTPLFRCSIVHGVRNYNQRWIVDNTLRTTRDKRNALLVQMKTPRKGSHFLNDTLSYAYHQQKQRWRRLRGSGSRLKIISFVIWKVMRAIVRALVRLRHLLSVQNVFAPTEADSKDSIICEPKGILYEYVYDTAEFRGGESPTLDLIIRTECKELMYHPWVRQLMDHKWNSFARQTFRQEFHLYFTYFVSFFIATYLHVGDTMVGMPPGGYRSAIFQLHDTYVEYLRDAARLLYSTINAHYTIQEFRSYKERGSLRAYFQDGWNWFDLVQISCVWMLLITEIVIMVVPEALASEDFELIVRQESLYGTTMWREYNLRTILMSIVGPQIFIKWIQFARGNKRLGPFVRMIFKMFRDIIVFLVVFLLFLLGFAFAFFILQIEGYRTFLSSIASVFQLSLGAWDWDCIFEGGPLAILLFILYAIVGTIMLLNLLIAMLGNTYDKVWGDRLLFFELERAKATLSIQTSLNDDEYDEKYWCQRLYVLEDDRPIEGIQLQKF